MRPLAGSLSIPMAILLVLSAIAGWSPGQAAVAGSGAGAHGHAHTHTHGGVVHTHHHRHTGDGQTRGAPGARQAGSAGHAPDAAQELGNDVVLPCQPDDDHHCCHHHDIGVGKAIATSRARERSPEATAAAVDRHVVRPMLLQALPRQWRPPARAGPPGHLLHLHTFVLLI